MDLLLVNCVIMNTNKTYCFEYQHFIKWKFYTICKIKHGQDKMYVEMSKTKETYFSFSAIPFENLQKIHWTFNRNGGTSKLTQVNFWKIVLPFS